MYRLWYSPLSAAMSPCSVLEEIGAGYELINLPWGRPRPAGYEALHPLSRVPVLDDDGVLVFESTAILTHLCDKHPDAGLAPPLATPERAHFYQWLAFFSSTLHAAGKPFNYPQRFTDKASGEAAVRRASARAVDDILRIVDRHMGDRPWVLGEVFSACDHVLHQHCCWIEQPEPGYVTLADYPNLAAFTARVRDESAGVRVMLARDAELRA